MSCKFHYLSLALGKISLCPLAYLFPKTSQFGQVPGFWRDWSTIPSVGVPIYLCFSYCWWFFFPCFFFFFLFANFATLLSIFNLCNLYREAFLAIDWWRLSQLKCNFDFVTWTIILASHITLSLILISLQPILIWFHISYTRQRRGSSLLDPVRYSLVLSQLAWATTIPYNL